jgi:hypothetical protein
LIERFISKETSDMAKKPSSGGLPPGTRVDQSGQYRNTTTKREVTVVRNEPLPPTQQPGQRYRLVDPTKHK